MLFLKSTGKEEVSKESSPSENETEEDEVDKYLETQDGWIERERDPKLFVLFSWINSVVVITVPKENVLFACPLLLGLYLISTLGNRKESNFSHFMLTFGKCNPMLDVNTQRVKGSLQHEFSDSLGA